MKNLVVLLAAIPLLAQATPTVIVDAIPSDAKFINAAAGAAPLADLTNADEKEVETGLDSALSHVIDYAEKNGVGYICVLSAPGTESREFTIASAHAKIKLPLKNPNLGIILYSGGSVPTKPVRYSLDKPEKGRQATSLSLKKISLPEQWTTGTWVYFNLTRIQDMAEKAGASQIFIESTGTGPTSPVNLPGSAEPLMVFADQAEIKVSWYAK